MTQTRGIRGATRVEQNTKEHILTASKNLILAIVRENDIKADDIAGVFFTATSDLNAEFPAYAVRDLGWRMVPVLCAQEMNVPNAMTRVIRILVFVNSSKPQEQIKHQYLGETKKLRPDLFEGEKHDSCDEI